jgi:hypothetical protein
MKLLLILLFLLPHLATAQIIVGQSNSLQVFENVSIDYIPGPDSLLFDLNGDYIADMKIYTDGFFHSGISWVKSIQTRVLNSNTKISTIGMPLIEGVKIYELGDTVTMHEGMWNVGKANISSFNPGGFVPFVLHYADTA